MNYDKIGAGKYKKCESKSCRELIPGMHNEIHFYSFQLF